MAGIPHIKLSELTKQIEDHIRQSFGSQLHWIVAEISGHKFYANADRHYFDWVEKIEGQNVETAKVKGIAWSGGAQNIKNFEAETAQQFTNGIQVLAQVRVEFHAIHGFSLILVDIDPSFTLGNLERQRRDTLLKLVELNSAFISKVGEEFVTRNKQIPLRAVIQNIALIASPNSEGYNDFIHTMKNNQFGYKFQIDEYQSSVQGALAENELVNTLIKIYHSKIEYDAVVIVRGGGAKTDFLVFDTYKVAQAVAKFPIPIITGIGHHKDVSITDLMVHTNTKTPTKAAEFIIEHARYFEEQVVQAQKSIIIKSQQLLNTHREEISATNNVIINQARILINNSKEGLAYFNQLVIGETKTMLYNSRSQLTNIQQQILNAARSKVHDTKTNLMTVNQGLINKANKLLYSVNTKLTAVNTSVKTSSTSAFNRSTNNLVSLNRIIISKGQTHLNKKQNLFAALVNRLTSKPLLITNSNAASLRFLNTGIQQNALRYVANKNTGLQNYKTLINAMSPDNILKKGFAMVSQNGKVIKDSKSVAVGSTLTITMNDTDINTSVISKTKKDGRK